MGAEVPRAAPGVQRVEVLVTGHVQGVGFRWETRHVLARLRLDGIAVNRPDGSVFVTAEGPTSGVGSLLDWLRSPDTPGRVDGVQVTWLG